MAGPLRSGVDRRKSMFFYLIDSQVGGGLTLTDSMRLIVMIKKMGAPYNRVAEYDFKDLENIKKVIESLNDISEYPIDVEHFKKWWPDLE